MGLDPHVLGISSASDLLPNQEIEEAKKTSSKRWKGINTPSVYFDICRGQYAADLRTKVYIAQYVLVSAR